MSRSFRSLTTRALTALVASGVAVAVLAACSASQWDTSEIDTPAPSTIKEYTRDEVGVRESLVDHLSTVGTNLNEWAAPRPQAECAATKVVDRFGVDRLLELGYEPQDGDLGLSYGDDERTAMMNILAGCIDFQAGLLEMFSAYQKLDFESAACVARGIDRRGLTREFAAGLLIGAEPDPFSNDNALAFGTTAILAECLDDQDLIPVIPQDPFPQDVGETTTTTAKPAEPAEGDGEGSETTTTTTEP
ncbi:MAG TPA: hypothetical protein VJM33_12905 [Microthrixaceae bacterium]|nr:hypothetical protein [Microthrixaceae bacterium]